MRWLLVAVWVIASRPAEACTPYPGSAPFMPDDAVEDVPPGAVMVESFSLYRSDIDRCGSVAYIRVVATATDDTTPGSELGFRFRVFSGSEPPRGFEGVHDLAGPNPELALFGSADDDLAFELAISAIDASGNAGTETLIPIYDDAGCNAGGAGLLPAALALLALGRRRSTGSGHTCVG